MTDFIFRKIEKLIKKHKTRDPCKILEEMGVVLFETDKYQKLKGYCFLSHRTTYVGINENLSEEEKHIVAAHELGHIILHRSLLCMAPMNDSLLYNMTDRTEYEANLFAADLLLPDEEVFNISFHFHQTGSRFKRGNRIYQIERKNQQIPARKAGIDFH